MRAPHPALSPEGRGVLETPSPSLRERAWVRVSLLALLAIFLPVAPLAAEAQQAANVYRIGFLGTATAEPIAPLLGALIVVGAPLTYMRRQQSADLALKNRLPGIHSLREYAQAGLLISYGPNLPDLYRRAAGYVAKILRGAKPADLPVDQPATFELVINLKTAKALGLTIPQSLLGWADEVIQ